MLRVSPYSAQLLPARPPTTRPPTERHLGWAGKAGRPLIIAAQHHLAAVLSTAGVTTVHYNIHSKETKETL